MMLLNVSMKLGIACESFRASSACIRGLFVPDPFAIGFGLLHVFFPHVQFRLQELQFELTAGTVDAALKDVRWIVREACSGKQLGTEVGPNMRPFKKRLIRMINRFETCFIRSRCV